MISLGIVGQLIPQALPLAASSTAFLYNATFFSGSSWLNRQAALTGLADGKTGLCSFWIKPMSGSVDSRAILTNTTTNFFISTRGDRTVQFRGYNAAASGILDLESTAVVDTGTWHHIAGSWDLANNLAFLFVDGVDTTLAFTKTNDTINYLDAANPNIAMATQAGFTTFRGCISEFWFNTEYLAIDTPSNLQKFRSSGGKPVNLGANGNTPTGNQPLIYLPNSSATYQNNVGSGGNFFLTGSLSACDDTE